MLSLLLLVVSVGALTGSEVSSFCSCDLTPSFCDYDCCCDTSCSSTISTDCYNSHSNSYCPDSTFFARIGSSFLDPSGCFYYNSSNTIVEEISLTISQVSTIVNTDSTFSYLPTSAVITKPGYQIGDTVILGGSSTFTFISSTGACLTTATSSVKEFTFKFGLNFKYRCTLSSFTIPLLFSSFSGKTLPKFSGGSETVSIPSFFDSALTQVEMKIVVGQYGSDGARYIERVVVSSSSSGSSVRTLEVRWVQPSEVMSAGSAPSFFPQLPSDLFYPIYLLK